jgi:hypothetical protein
MLRPIALLIYNSIAPYASTIHPGRYGCIAIAGTMCLNALNVVCFASEALPSPLPPSHALVCYRTALTNA